MNSEHFPKAGNLSDHMMAVDAFSDMLAASGPSEVGRRLTEQLRELTGTCTVMLFAHPEGAESHRLLHVCPLGRESLFSAAELGLLCPDRTPEDLPRSVEALAPEHPLRAFLLQAGVGSLLRVPLRVGGKLLATLLLLDLDRIDETARIVSHLAPVIALALNNSLENERSRLMASELERYVDERTAELMTANKALAASRLAALNLMEDAVAAQRRAEQIAVELQREITERSRMESALRTSEEEFRSLAGAVPQIVWICLPDGWTIYFNQQWMDYTGLTLEESLGHDWIKPFHPDDRQRAWDAWKNATQTGELYVIECRLRSADGIYRWWLIRGLPFRDASGKILKWFGTCTDIDDIKQTEAALRETKAILQAAMDQSAAGIAIADAPDGKLRYVNRAGLMIRGEGEADGVSGVDINQYVASWKILNLDGSPMANEEVPLARAIIFGEQCSREFIIRRSEHEDRIVLANAAPILDASGKITAGIVVFHDITQRKKADDALRESALALEQKNAEMERFLYTASHDLKSPIVTIKTFLGYLEKDLALGDAERITKDMYYLRVGAEKIAVLLDDLLEFSRVGRMVNPPEPITFQSLVDEAIVAVGGRIAEQGVAVRVDGADVPLLGDRLRLSEIWQTLVENACKFMGSQKEPLIEIGFEVRDAETVFFVRDNGIGIDSRYQAKVFSLFEKLDPNVEGTGIGLALVKRIVGLYQGRVWVESHGLGLGAGFYFTLPGAVNNINENQNL